ncbi:MAG: hypothetical protein IT355_12070 [Gemmatimonadaceae bacterium]|nr:hypothetical protein [Gemmatimonadaceae bacterium]
MWIRRQQFEELAREAGAATALSREVTHLRTLVRALTSAAPAAARAAAESAQDIPAITDGLHPELLSAIATFADGDQALERQLAREARKRLRRLRRPPTEDDITALAVDLAEGIDPDEAFV